MDVDVDADAEADADEPGRVQETAAYDGALVE